MLLNATLLALLGFTVHRTWVLCRFMRDGAKSHEIFFLLMVTGLCLITNVIAPFIVAGLIVSALEVRSLLTQA
jgi:hypothetical protein